MDTPSLSSFAFERRIFFSERLRFLGNQSTSGPASTVGMIVPLGGVLIDDHIQ